MPPPAGGKKTRKRQQKQNPPYRYFTTIKTDFTEKKRPLVFPFVLGRRAGRFFARFCRFKRGIRGNFRNLAAAGMAWAGWLRAMRRGVGMLDSRFRGKKAPHSGESRNLPKMGAFLPSSPIPLKFLVPKIYFGTHLHGNLLPPNHISAGNKLPVELNPCRNKFRHEKVGKKNTAPVVMRFRLSPEWARFFRTMRLCGRVGMLDSRFRGNDGGGANSGIGGNGGYGGRNWRRKRRQQPQTPYIFAS